jgi:hypothetical protein
MLVCFRKLDLGALDGYGFVSKKRKKGGNPIRKAAEKFATGNRIRKKCTQCLQFTQAMSKEGSRRRKDLRRCMFELGFVCEEGAD